MRLILVSVAALAVAGCSQTFPIVAMGKDLPGGVLRGEGRVDLSGGVFAISGGSLTCNGTYDGLDSSVTITIPIRCNDGRTGIVSATRQKGGRGGGGPFTLSDGTTGQFIFGPAAAGL